MSKETLFDVVKIKVVCKKINKKINKKICEYIKK